MAQDEKSGTAQATAQPTTQSFFEGLLSAESTPSPRETPNEPEEVETTESESEGQPEEGTSAEAEQSDAPEGESDETESEPNETATPQTFTVKIDGKDESVTIDELLKGYSRTADYTRKTQALAEERRKLEGIAAERAQYATKLQQLDQALESMKPQEPDWETLRQQDPNEYQYQWVEWQRYQQQHEAIRAERTRAEQQVQQDQENAFRVQVVDEQRKLSDAIPAWKNTEVAKKEKAEIREYGLSLGYTDADLNGVLDHRAIVVLRNAMLYARSQKAKPALKQKLEAVKVVTPGTKSQKKPVAQITRDKQRLAKTGRVEHAAPIFLSVIQSED